MGDEKRTEVSGRLVNLGAIRSRVEVTSANRKVITDRCEAVIPRDSQALIELNVRLTDIEERIFAAIDVDDGVTVLKLLSERNRTLSDFGAELSRLRPQLMKLRKKK